MLQALDALDALLCCRCGDMLEDAHNLSDGRRTCTACTCDGCHDQPYRFRDEDNDDEQLCERCVISKVSR